MTLLRLFFGFAIVVTLALLAFIFLPVQTTPPQQALPGDYTIPEGAPEYVMRTADCAACHTAEDGDRFAGGRPIESPMGTIYSSNITPDPVTGIGNYTLDQFRSVLYDGMRADGAHLYPAMPYANYRRLTEEDVRALYAYFMDQVEPVSNEVPETNLAFPFDQRWGIRAWKWVALGDAGFTPPFDDDQLNRGAYLVEGPGHCGACHSRRNTFFAQAGYAAEDDAFLSGGVIAGWTAPDLRGARSAPQEWSREDLVAFLGSGRNSHAAVTGEMTLVIAESLQYLTNEDMEAVAAYLRHIGLDGPASGSPPEREPETGDAEAILIAAEPGLDLGPRLYLDNCNACHFANGMGADEVFPELDGNSLVTADKSTGLISMILYGAALPSTAERPARLRMPGFGDRLSDDEVATLATFVRQAWSNRAGAVSSAEVADRRDTQTGN